MKTIASFSVLALLALAAAPVASANFTTVCTPPSVPVGACVSVTLGSTTLYYADPNVGQTWSYTCAPYGLACVLTPDVTYTYRSITIPWVSTSGTYVWCTICAADGTDATPHLP